METIRKNDSGAAVEDIQEKLIFLGYLPKAGKSGIYDDDTAVAVTRFCS